MEAASCGFKSFTQIFHQSRGLLALGSKNLQPCTVTSLACRKFYNFELFSSFKDTRARAIESETCNVSLDEGLTMKISQDVVQHLNGRSIYLVGMMGSGKTTVGKILSDVLLGYSCIDSDKLVEQAVGATVDEIFKQHGEDFFRNNESEVLRDLSAMHRLVVATGGGSAIDDTNWEHMKHGVTAWLDVPLEVLARRIAAVGTESRPVLPHKSCDPYTDALEGLLEESKKRGNIYVKANARVSLKQIASKKGIENVFDLTPTDIAIEALVQINKYLVERTPNF